MRRVELMRRWARLGRGVTAAVAVSLLIATPLGTARAAAASAPGGAGSRSARVRTGYRVTPMRTGYRRAPVRARTGSRTTTGTVVYPSTALIGAQDQQRIDGFGASGAWWPTDLARFSAASRRQLGQLLFSQDGLYLSQYRYNIGGGGVGVTVPYKAPPAFLSASGRYDWNADPAGLTFLKQAAAFRVPELIGFVNSAPAAFTTNHQDCGGDLAPGSVSAFARYLAQVVVHLRQSDHLQLDYVSPMNEPDTTQRTCQQEGMGVPVAERAPLVKALAADLGASQARAGVIGDESSLETQLLEETPDWLPAAGSSVSVVAHHAYDYPRPATLDRVARLKARHWSTEICCFNGHGFGWQYDPTMASGLWLADTIWNDLALAHDSAFDWWVAASPNMGCTPTRDPGCQGAVNPAGRNDGLVYFDPHWQTDGNQALYLTKRYWVMAGFSRYVRPGAVMHQVYGLPIGVRGVAFQQRTDWVVEVINDSTRPYRQADIRLPPGSTSGAVGYQTDQTRNLAPFDVDTVSGIARVGLTPHSLTTLVFPLGTSRAVRTQRSPGRIATANASGRA